MRTNIPRYQQVAAVIRQKIIDGTYAADEKIPAEDVLANEWGVSRMTMRQAMAELVADGFIMRKQGRGTFVCRPNTQTTGPTLHGTMRDLVAATQTPQVSVVSIQHSTQLPKHIAASLRLSPDNPGTVIHRLRHDSDGAPFGILVNYMSDQVGYNIDRSAIENTTLIEAFTKIGLQARSADQWIRAQIADVEVSNSLRILVGDPVLAVERVVFDEKGEPLEILKSWYRSDLYSYRVIFGSAYDNDDVT